MTLPFPAELRVQHGPQQHSYPLEARVLRVGRDPGCDIPLALGYVSRLHALLEPSGAGHRLTDQSSLNGLLHAGQRVGTLELSHGDVVRIGDPESGDLVSLTYLNPAVPARSRSLDLSVLPLEVGRRYTLGREGADFALPDPQVSRRHAEVERLPDGRLRIEDLGSSNGVLLEGALVRRAEVSEGARFTIGGFELRYAGGQLERSNGWGRFQLSAQNLSRFVSKGGKKVPILQAVSLTIEPGEFVALVGGSGAGKSTLMKALLGLVQTEGEIRVNRFPLSKGRRALSSVLGYVPQDDIVHGSLTVQGALEYAARLRLPPDTSLTARQTRVQEVLSEVRLGNHAHKVIERLSGGQRKRVSVACELLTNPRLFFLDEPTSGLDPGLEKKVMLDLRLHADAGRTVVLVTHATANIRQCDLIAFLAEGRLVYFGPPGEALSFFGVNQDFADIYPRLEGKADDPEHAGLIKGELSSEYQVWRVSGGLGVPSLAELWERRFLSSRQHAQYVQSRRPQVPLEPPSFGPASRLRGVSTLCQLGTLLARYLRVTLQDRGTLISLLLQVPIVIAVMALVVKFDALSGAAILPRSKALQPLFFMTVSAVLFGMINAAREITKERSILSRERLSGLSVRAYLASKLILFGGLGLLQAGAFVGLLSLLVRFPAQGGILWPLGIELGVGYFLSTLAGLSLGLAISTYAPNPDRAITLVPTLFIVQLVFAGLFFPLEGVSAWLSYFTVSRWSLGVLGASAEVNRFCGKPTPCTDANLYTSSSEHLWTHWGVLLLYSALCLLLAGLAVRQMGRPQR